MPDELSEFPSDEFLELPADALSEMSADALSADALSEVPSEALSEVPPSEPPQPPSEAVAEPKAKREPGRFIKAFNVYNAMLMVSFVAISIATLLLILELGRYGFTVRPPQR